MKIITLNRVHNDGSYTLIHFNIEKLIYMFVNSTDNTTIVYGDDRDSIFVAETPNQIKELIKEITQ